ncbi:MAG: SGNH/GDSL hydrolase family protein [Saccharofermentans sp.]|nr:SGNH/GDSL hydrolase family protein [Saccharofermentans sp.]
MGADKKKSILSLLTPAVLLAFVIVCVVFYQHDKRQKAYYASIQSSLESEEAYLKELQSSLEEQKASIKEAESSIALYEEYTLRSCYSRISSGKPVNILIVGDSISEGTGASDKMHSWPELLKERLTSRYKSEVRLDNVSMGGESSLAGYTRLIQQDSTYYDLVIFCYGQNDKDENFEIYYEAMVRKALSNYPDCSVISILQHSQRSYTYKMNCINDIAGYYKIPVVDCIKLFDEQISGYDSYVTDGVHLNDSGHALYSEAVFSVIEEQIQNSALPVHKAEQPKYTDTSFFDNSYWIPSERFTRNGNSYSIELPDDIKGSGIPSFYGGNGVLIVVDIIDYPGENVLTVYNNGKMIAERKNNWKYSFRQRHIPEISHDLVIEKGSFTIEFSDAEQADSFNGCGFVLGG